LVVWLEAAPGGMVIGMLTPIVTSIPHAGPSPHAPRRGAQHGGK
jgi:hypothetical protein